MTILIIVAAVDAMWMNIGRYDTPKGQSNGHGPEYILQRLNHFQGAFRHAEDDMIA